MEISYLVTWRIQLQVTAYYCGEYSLTLIFLKVFQKMMYCLVNNTVMNYINLYSTICYDTSTEEDNNWIVMI